MIRELYIKNYLVIEHALLSFEAGINIITGETGAGKSIIIGAVDIVTGGRIDASVIRKGEASTTISAVFDLNNDVKKKLNDNEIAVEDELIIKRVIKSTGKSVSYINDQRVTVSFVKSLKPFLFEIVSQFANSSLKELDYQMKIVDSLGDYDDVIADVKDKFYKYTAVSKELDDLKRKIDKVNEQKDFLLFQKKELESLDLENFKIDDIENEIEMLKNNQKFIDKAAKLSEIINGEINIYSLTSRLEKLVSALPIKDKENKINQIDDFLSTLNELEDEFENIVSMDPNEVVERLDELQGRYFKFLELSKKYSKDRDELLVYYNTLCDDLKLQDNSQLDIKEYEKKLKKAEKDYLLAAKELTNKRKELNDIYGEKICRSMEQLGIKGGELFFDVRNSENYSVNGVDVVEIMAKTNIGEDFGSILKIASGGELSRILLILKEYSRVSIDSMIFDEVDTGIGGETATKLAKHISVLAKKYQLIVITHLQQIASKGDSHFSVSKFDDKDRTFVAVNKLSREDRVLEIARMIGDSKDQNVINTAEMLLGHS